MSAQDPTERRRMAVVYKVYRELPYEQQKRIDEQSKTVGERAARNLGLVPDDPMTGQFLCVARQKAHLFWVDEITQSYASRIGEVLADENERRAASSVAGWPSFVTRAAEAMERPERDRIAEGAAPQ